MLMMIPIPFFDKYICSHTDGILTIYLMSEIMISFMFVRLYFIMGTFVNYGEFSDAYSKKLCKSYGFESDIRFSVKCLYITAPEATVFWVFTMTVLIFAYILRIYEVPY